MGKKAANNKKRGNAYELKIIKELKEITKDQELCSTRLASRALDNEKIDVYDGNNTIPFHIQIKKTMNYPSFSKIKRESKKKDKPFLMFWAVQESKEKSMRTLDELVVLDKLEFYKLLQLIYEKQATDSRGIPDETMSGGE